MRAVACFCVALTVVGCVRREPSTPSTNSASGDSAGPADVVFYGRSVSEWLERVRSGSEEQANQAAEVLPNLFSIREPARHAVPTLAKALSDEHPKVRSVAAATLGSLPPEHAKSAVTALLERVGADRGQPRIAIARALWRIEKHPKCVDALTETLNDSDPSVRAAAANALREIGAAAKSAYPSLVELAKDPDVDVRCAAVAAVVVVQGDPKATVAALRAALNDANIQVRAAAAAATGGLRESAADLVPVLIDLLKDKDNANVRRAAMRGLGNIGPSAKAAVTDLVGLLSDDEQRLRGDAARALVQIGVDSVPALRVAAGSENAYVRLHAVNALGALTPKAPAAAEALVRALKDEDGQIRLQAAMFLANHQAAADVNRPIAVMIQSLVDASLRQQASQSLVDIGPAAIPMLSEALADPNATIRGSAAGVLALLGPRAKAGVPALKTALNDKDLQVRWRVADALRLIGEGEMTVPTWIDLLGNKHSEVRMKALTALGEIGAHARASESAIIAALKTEDRFVLRGAAAEALGRIGATSPATIEALQHALSDEYPHVTARAADALARLGPAGHAAVPSLITLLQHPSANVRMTAASALARMGPSAKSASAALAKATNDAVRGVREAAVSALAAVDPPATPQAP
jgi:HEAT repeat protein